ncbi:hypothetical protein [uncultured Streptomyces sp.]|uniref:hypothetical protein n=1 Tax=uncultured Streptomyces sp. TaxID=174707 RepID=UPI0026047AB7|nr:hypothetical protein [uncultured Streptomyces sp.]
MVRGIRNTIGLILALIGAAAALWAPFRNWYAGRLGHDFRVWELFTGAGVTNSGAGLFASLFLPLLVAAVLTVIGVVLRSRLLVALAGVVALGFAILWMVRQGQAEGSLTVSGDGQGLGSGVGLALLGGLLMLIGAAVMGGRVSRAVRREHDEKQRREAVAEDRERSGARADAPYGMAAREQDDRGGRGREEFGERGGSGARSGDVGRPPADAPPQSQPRGTAPRGRPVPARDTDASDRAGRGDADRTQYEHGDGSGGSGGSHTADDHRSRRWQRPGDDGA